MSSETSLCRHITSHFCQGNGCDVGSGGDPVVPWAIQVDLEDEEFRKYGHAHEVNIPIQWKGDARALPFKDGTLSFCYSSHLIEDFENWQGVLEEFTRVIKPGGYLIIMAPDRERFRAAVAAGQGDNLSHRHEFHVGELTNWALQHGGFQVIFDQLTLVRGVNDYNILFVAKKL